MTFVARHRATKVSALNRGLAVRYQRGLAQFGWLLTEIIGNATCKLCQGRHGIPRKALRLRVCSSRDPSSGRHADFAFLFFSALNFAHRALVAFEIFALAAADITLFLTCVTSRTVVTPSAFAADLTPFNFCCSLPNSFSSFRSSRLIAASRSMVPPGRNLS